MRRSGDRAGWAVTAEDADRRREHLDLARVAAFRVGALSVAPATRQVARGGTSETLEPRVMQVLVALCQADGAVVTRDDLIARCWDGRIVGDNAIHRAVSRLREVAASLGRDCFQIDTVAKVGYRLIALEEPAAAGPLPASVPRPRRWRLAAGAAAAVLAAAVALLAWRSHPMSATSRIALVAAPGNGSAELAGGLAIDLARLAGARGNAVAFAAGAEGGEGAYLLKIAERSARGGAEADVALTRSGSPDLIWSAAFAAADGGTTGLRAQAANAVAGTVECALQANGDQSRASNAQLRALFAACDRLDDDPDDALVAAWRRAVALEPDNAAALASLSYVEASQQTFASDPAAVAGLRAAAREHLTKARAMGDRLALSYAAEALLMPNSRYAEQLAIIDRGLARDGECAILHGLKYKSLSSVGFMEDALDSARRAVALDPSSPFTRETLISALAYGGFAQSARSEIQAAERIWPESHILRDARMRFEFRFGDAVGLLREIDRGSALPNSPWNVQHGPERLFLLARAQPTQKNIDALVAFSFRHANRIPMSLQSLGGLGLVDRAYEMMKDPRAVDAVREVPGVLFRANMRPFVLDRRFMALADRLGLLRFWRSRQAWPDFCRDKDIAYDCEAEASRLHPKPA